MTKWTINKNYPFMKRKWTINKNYPFMKRERNLYMDLLKQKTKFCLKEDNWEGFLKTREGIRNA